MLLIIFCDVTQNMMIMMMKLLMKSNMMTEDNDLDLNI